MCAAVRVVRELTLYFNEECVEIRFQPRPNKSQFSSSWLDVDDGTSCDCYHAQNRKPNVCARLDHLAGVEEHSEWIAPVYEV